MIFIKLLSGLGNQMFQYAFARSLAHDLNKELYLDISIYNFNIHVEHMVYGLHPYNIKAIVGNYPAESYHNNSKLYKGDMNIYKEGGILTYKGFCCRNLLFENMKDIKFPAYFTGHYILGYNEKNQRVITEDFFKHNRDIIHEDLRFMWDLPEEYENVVEDIKQHDSIALHVRRGDYKLYPKFGICSPNYFNDAINEVVKDLDNPKFFIFTQDYEWFKNNIKMDFPHEFVDFNEDEDVLIRRSAHHLKLMSLCDHFIISNSTYSWWGAWLSENQNKKIISPRPWFQSRETIEAKSIDNIPPIQITNNYEDYFNKSDKVIFKMDDLNDIIHANRVEINKENDYFRINTLERDSDFIIRPFDNHDENNEIIIKISMETNAHDATNFFYRASEKEDFGWRKSFYMRYFENEDFTHYVILPENIESLKIRPATEKGRSIILKDFEIRELDKNNNPNK